MVRPVTFCCSATRIRGASPPPGCVVSTTAAARASSVARSPIPLPLAPAPSLVRGGGGAECVLVSLLLLLLRHQSQCSLHCVHVFAKCTHFVTEESDIVVETLQTLKAMLQYVSRDRYHSGVFGSTRPSRRVSRYRDGFGEAGT